LINKFIKHDHINYPCCDINYLDLYLSFSFFNFVCIYCWWVFFFHFFMQCLLICLVRCVHNFFELHIRIVLYKKTCWKFMQDHICLLCFEVFIWSLFILFLFFSLTLFFNKKFIIFNFTLQLKFIVYFFYFILHSFYFCHVF
jgi:hypothetical protein